MTSFICIAIVIISLLGFNNPQLRDKLMLDPYVVNRRNEWYRLFSCALVHADFIHLAFNVIAFYSFGRMVEFYFAQYSPHMQNLLFITLCIGGQLASVGPSYLKHRNNYNYRSLGASGMVMAVITASVIFNPWNKMSFYFIPMPGIVFAIVFMAYEYYASKNVHDNINHDAHYWGGVFGAAFVLISNPGLALLFVQQLLHPVF